jgi:hypothetical protein
MTTVRPSSKGVKRIMGLTFTAALSAAIIPIMVDKKVGWAPIAGAVLIVLVVSVLCFLSLRLRRIRRVEGAIEFRSSIGRTTTVYDNQVLRAIYAPQVVDGAGGIAARLMLRDNAGDTIRRLTGDQWNAAELDSFARSFRYGLEIVPGPIGGAALYAMHPDAASYFELHTLRVLGIGLLAIALIVGVAAFFRAQ